MRRQQNFLISITDHFEGLVFIGLGLSKELLRLQFGFFWRILVWFLQLAFYCLDIRFWILVFQSRDVCYHLYDNMFIWFGSWIYKKVEAD